MAYRNTLPLPLLPVVCAAASAFYVVTTADAETVVVLKYPFAVDKIETVDDSSVTVTLFGTTRLVKRAELEDEVVRAYLGRKDLFTKVELEGFAPFLREAVTRGKTEWGIEALGRALASDALSDDAVTGLVKDLQSLPNGKPVLQAVIQHISDDVPHGRAVCSMLIALAESDVEWVKSKAVRPLFRHQVMCEAVLGERYSEALGTGDLTVANKLMSIYGALYGLEGEAYRRILALGTKVDRVVESLRAGEVASAERGFAALAVDPSVKELIPSLLAKLVFRFADVAIEDRRYGDALRLLTIASHDEDAAGRVAAILEYAKKIAGSSFQELHTLVSPPNVQQLLRTLSAQSALVRTKYQELLDVAIPLALRQGRVREATQLLDELVIVRPDPSAQNDRIRLIFAEMYFTLGDIDGAKQAIAEAQTGVPFNFKLRVSLAGYRLGGWFIAALTALIVLLLGSWAWSYAKRKFSLAEFFKAKPKPAVEPDPDEPLKKFVSVSRQAGMRAPLDIYSEALSVFGLKSGVTLQQIKVAYRNAVKECHPDLNPNASKAQTSKFIELTRAYERLLDLHFERTGER